jgi:hypothetical protein
MAPLFKTATIDRGCSGRRRYLLRTRGVSARPSIFKGVPAVFLGSSSFNEEAYKGW